MVFNATFKNRPVTWTCGVTMTSKEHSRDFPSDHSRKLQWYQYTCFTGYGTNPPIRTHNVSGDRY
jgi:hypothetical protein